MKKTLPIIIVVALALGGLLAWSSSFQATSRTSFFNDTDVACLPNGHQQLALHVHPFISIFVDGVQEPIPANIGINSACMSEMHTHDPSGEIHVETVSRERFDQLSFADFFKVWNQPIDRDGYTMDIIVDGNPVDSLEQVPIRDGERVEIRYTAISE